MSWEPRCLRLTSPCGGHRPLPWGWGLRGISVPPGTRPLLPHVLCLLPMVTHCSGVRTARLARLVTSGSTLTQYSVSQTRSGMWNSELVSSNSYCNERAGWYPGAPVAQLGLGLSSLLLHPLGKVP